MYVFTSHHSLNISKQKYFLKRKKTVNSTTFNWNSTQKKIHTKLSRVNATAACPSIKKLTSCIQMHSHAISHLEISQKAEIHIYQVVVAWHKFLVKHCIAHLLRFVIFVVFNQKKKKQQKSQSIAWKKWRKKIFKVNILK